jgi:hypothetical protein
MKPISLNSIKIYNAPCSQKTQTERIVRSHCLDADADLGSIFITQLQKQMMEKAEERNMAALNLVAQSFQELRNECSNMTAILEKIAKLQTYAVKAEKNTLSEIKEMNKGLRDSDKGEMIRNRVESIAASEMPSAKSEDRERLDIKNQFQINIFPNISKVEKVNTKDA